MRDVPIELDPFLLAAVGDASPEEVLRRDLEDAAKEYGELDLLVELLQNAADGLDERRYRSICQAAGRNPNDPDTVARWNAAVTRLLEEDYAAYNALAGNVRIAAYYQQCADEAARRGRWWQVLAETFGANAEALDAASRIADPLLRVTVRVGPPHWIEVEDSGVGIGEIAASFRHKSSSKRAPSRLRRLGVRGSHGWGLTAVLAYSDRIEVISRVDGREPAAFAFSDYAAFARGTVERPRNETIDLAGPHQFLSERVRTGASGTHVRVLLAAADPGNVLGNTLGDFNQAKFVRLLRLYTPLGQLNDYVFHPAFHNLRRSDFSAEFVSYTAAGEQRTVVPFDTLRFEEERPEAHYSFDRYVGGGMPSGMSVHTIHRSRRANSVILTGADIQAAVWVVRDLEEPLRQRNELPMTVSEPEGASGEIPRGFVLALSGGMRSEHIARPVRGNTANYRGVVLSEAAPPTLGRKHVAVVDQRNAVARTAQDHETRYDEIRQHTLPEREPPAGTPAEARWVREYIQAALDGVAAEQPRSESLRIWAGRASGEAQVMLAFAELIGLGLMGDFKILRVHYREIYDFVFWQQARLDAGVIPELRVARELARGGYAALDDRTRSFTRLGIGEFKADGHAILDDFDPLERRKHPNTPDLLICHSFDTDSVEEKNWNVNTVAPNEREFPLQTHIWVPASPAIERRRRLAVVSLVDAIRILVESGQLRDRPTPWPDALPRNHY